MKKIIPFVVVWMVAVAFARGDAQVAGPAAAKPGVLTGSTGGQQVRRAAPAEGTAADTEAAFVTQYCATCHNQRLKTGGLVLDTKDIAHVGPDAETWEKVVRKVKTGMMPPAGARRPERSALDGFAAELETRLDRAAVPNANLSTPALHRLNRSEYRNAIRDLLGMDVDVNALLPGDGSSEGFDNLAEALSVSPSLVQGYVSAAMKISRQAVGDRTMAPQQLTFRSPPGLSQDVHIEGLPLGTRGGMLVDYTFPLDAEYEFSIGGGGGGPGGGQGAGAGLDFTIDGHKIPVTNPRKFRLPIQAGPRTIGIAIVDRVRSAGVDDIYSDFREDAVFKQAGGIQNIVITGPFDPSGVGDTPSRRHVFVCKPGDPAGPAVRTASARPAASVRGVALAANRTAAVQGRPAATGLSETACARRIVSTLARRAYRGPVSDAEVATLLQFYQQGRAGADFETGIQQALARILVAPRFVFRAEDEPKAVAPGAVYRISDVDLASRLSFFLWSSIPDETLLDAAMKGRLRNPAVLDAQVKRMLADPKADALIRNFAGQWLYLRELDNVQTEAKNFDDNLREAFRTETEMLFGSIVRNNRPLTELLNANYTFVDERLAKHYGLPNVHGTYFRKVMLPDDSPRRGILGEGSMLTVTSVATRTSPVQRGKWILENLLGVPPPQPPPGVETNLDKDAAQVKVTSLRQRLELHRASPVCASCHNIMDPLGFSLENFDLVGTWREFDGPTKIDSTGKLADGTPLTGIADLRRAVLSRSDAFMTTASVKLMTYALGRPVSALDMPDVRTIVRRAKADDNRFSSLVMGVIESGPFQKRLKKAPTATTETQ
jgi:mono/diheme cytochrome c family protein